METRRREMLPFCPPCLRGSMLSFFGFSHLRDYKIFGALKIDKKYRTVILSKVKNLLFFQQEMLRCTQHDTL